MKTLMNQINAIADRSQRDHDLRWAICEDLGIDHGSSNDEIMGALNGIVEERDRLRGMVDEIATRASK